MQVERAVGSPLSTYMELVSTLGYYLLVLPLSVPMLVAFTYCAWVGWRLFINN